MFIFTLRKLIGIKTSLNLRTAILYDLTAFVIFLALLVVSLWILSGQQSLRNLITKTPFQTIDAVPLTGPALYKNVTAKVIPPKGFQSQIFLGESVLHLSQNGVIDKNKFLNVYQKRGGLPASFQNVFDEASYKPILLTKDNAQIYVNLLWPIGLSNSLFANVDSPINGKDLANFASTGGWNLGQADNGTEYFNKFNIVSLSKRQQTQVLKIAQTIYRPCCNNSTFFQDCNHGSALLGLLELGVSQGLSEERLYKEALAFNSFWFPDNYIQTALYFKIKKGVDWENINPKEVLSYKYSAITPWMTTVAPEIAKIPNLLPPTNGGVACGT